MYNFEPVWIRKKIKSLKMSAVQHGKRKIQRNPEIAMTCITMISVDR